MLILATIVEEEGETVFAASLSFRHDSKLRTDLNEHPRACARICVERASRNSRSVLFGELVSKTEKDQRRAAQTIGREV